MKDIITAIFSRIQQFIEPSKINAPGTVIALVRHEDVVNVFIHVPFLIPDGQQGRRSRDDVYIHLRDATAWGGNVIITHLTNANSPKCKSFQEHCIDRLQEEKRQEEKELKDKEGLNEKEELNDEEGLKVVMVSQNKHESPSGAKVKVRLSPEIQAYVDRQVLDRSVHDHHRNGRLNHGTIVPPLTRLGELQHIHHKPANPPGPFGQIQHDRGDVENRGMGGQLYMKTFDDAPTEELWHVIVLAVLKLSPKDKTRLMEPLLATVALELFGIE
jgi:hypothetical protein